MSTCEPSCIIQQFGGRAGRDRRAPWWLAGLLLIGAAPVWGEGQLPPGFTVSELPTLGGDASYALGVNSLGVVVGQAEDASGVMRSVLMQASDVVGISEPSEVAGGAMALNEAGEVVTYAIQPDGSYNASYVYRVVESETEPVSVTRVAEIPTFGLPGTVSIPSAVNFLGQIAGYCPSATGYRAFLAEGESITDLGTLGGNNSWASDINNEGEVVGWAETSVLLGPDEYQNGPPHAFVYRNGTMRDLGTLGGSQSRAYAINDLGQIVGVAANSAEEDVAVRWEGDSIAILEAPEGAKDLRPTDINNSGQIVGMMLTPNGYRAFLANSPTSVVDLNTLIPAGSGWVLTEAKSINHIGEIAGVGILNGEPRGFLLSPGN